MPEDNSHYTCYLLRLRRMDNAGQPVWRFTLESPGGGSPQVFSSLDELLAFLQTLTAGADRPGAQPITTGDRRC